MGQQEHILKIYRRADQKTFLISFPVFHAAQIAKAGKTGNLKRVVPVDLVKKVRIAIHEKTPLMFSEGLAIIL